jgi:low affinity Fe/Cu permease
MRPTTTVSGVLSRALHRIVDWLSHALVAPLIGTIVAGFLVLLAAMGHPESWQTGFATGASAVTLVMVFVIQHTQGRQQHAIQLKLDEIIRVLPGADDHFVHVEVAAEEELIEIDHRLDAHHHALREA